MQYVCLERGRKVIKGELWVDGWAIFRALRTSFPKLLDKYYQNFKNYHDFAIIFNTVDENNNVDNNKNIDDNSGG